MSERKLDLTAAGYVFFEDKLLLIHHTKLNMWLPPGGHIEPNETPDDAALREVLEETGIDADILDIYNSSVGHFPHFVRENPLPFYANVHSVGDHDHYGACFICEAKSDKVVKEDGAIKDSRWMTRDEVINDEAIRPDIKAIALKAFDLRQSYFASRSSTH